MNLSQILIAAALFTVIQGHMKMTYPAPFRSPDNPIALAASPGTIDYNILSPLTGDGSNFPCKGYHVDMGTAAGASVATWAVGSSVNMTIVGGAFHGGGSCQASLSFDKGASFTVIHSWQGNCPLQTSGNFDFTIPPSTPAGSAIFAWSWMNQIGNREYYMNCASVTIAAASARKLKARQRGFSSKRDSSMAFSSRPGLFVANLGNGCTTTEGTDVQFPDPGPDVTSTSTVLKSISGCQAVKGVGGASGSSSSGSGSGSSASPAATSASPAETPSPSTSASASPSGFITSYTPASPSSSSSSTPDSTPNSSNSTISPLGLCTGSFTCNSSPSGPCCSQYGYCGVTPQHCDLAQGCNPEKGECGLNSTTSGTGAATGNGTETQSTGGESSGESTSVATPLAAAATVTVTAAGASETVTVMAMQTETVVSTEMGMTTAYETATATVMVTTSITSEKEQVSIIPVTTSY